MSVPLFIGCADLHFSKNAPPLRAGEPNWLEAQARQMFWLGEQSQKYGVPIVCAGDVFDKAQGTADFVNFVADNIPFMFSCPGNHDLPYHNMDKLDLSMYGALVRMGRLDSRCSGFIGLEINGVNVAFHLFPFGADLEECDKQGDVDVAVIHHFVWTGKSKMAKFMPECELSLLLEQLRDYDYYLFGDNHIPFVSGNVVNCGSFMRRIKGEEEYHPTVPLFYDDHIEFLEVPVDKDVLTIRENIERPDDKHEFTEFFKMLDEASRLTCDVSVLLEEELRKQNIEKKVRDAIISITQ